MNAFRLPRRLILTTLLLAGLPHLALAAATSPADPEKPITLAKTPALVQATIKSTAGNDTVGNIVRHADDEGVVFAVETTKTDGSTRDLLIANNGTLLSQEVTLTEITGPALAAIKTQAGKNKITAIDKTFDDEDIAYEVTMETLTGEKNFTVSDSGKLERIDLLPSEAPVVVSAAIKRNAGSDQVILVEKVFDPPDVSYDVTVSDKDGLSKTFSLDPTGKLTSKEITLEQAPKLVQAMIVMQAGKNKLLSVNENFDDTGITYDALITAPGGRTRDFTVDNDGKLLSEQVFIDQVPAEARKTILEQIGNGKIIEIDKSYEEDSGVLPFVVHGMKGGKEFDFSVGPKGRFLGMDD